MEEDGDWVGWINGAKFYWKRENEEMDAEVEAFYREQEPVDVNDLEPDEEPDSSDESETCTHFCDSDSDCDCERRLVFVDDS